MQTFPGAQLHLVPVASAAAGRDLMVVHCMRSGLCRYVFIVESKLRHQGTTPASVAE